jgi:hypothetical protein
MGLHLDRGATNSTPSGRGTFLKSGISTRRSPGEAEVLARLRLAVELARRDVVAHAVDLVVGEPQVAVGRVEVMADRVPDAAGEDLAARAVGVHPDHAADADPVVHLDLVGRLHVVRLAERDVELAVRSHAADAGGVVEALFLRRDQFALRHDDAHRRVGSLEEELGRREDEHAVALGDVEEPVAREAGTVRDVEGDRGREVLHLVRHAVAVAVDDRPDLVLPGAREDDRALGRHGHRACVRHDGVEADLEAVGHVDVLDDVVERVSRGTVCGISVKVASVRCMFDSLSMLSCATAGAVSMVPSNSPASAFFVNIPLLPERMSMF